MPAPGIPYDWSIVTVNVNIDVNRFALRASRTQSQTNMKSVWNPPTLHILTFNILTQETVFLEVPKEGGSLGRGVGVLCGLSYLKICLQACPFCLSAVFRSLAFSPLPCFLCLFAVTESLAQATGSFLVVISFNIFFLDRLSSTLVYQPGSLITGWAY